MGKVHNNEKIENDVFIVKVGRKIRNIVTIGDQEEFKNGVFYIKLDDGTNFGYEKVGAKIGNLITHHKIESIYINIKKKLDSVLYGLYLRLWKMNKIKKVNILVPNNTCFDGFNRQKTILDCITTARQLAGTAPNICTPEWIKNHIKDNFSKIKIFDKNDIQKMNMNMLMSVGKGSVNEPYVVQINTPKKPKIALIGKGVTFDSGGISIKPSKDMHHMLGDMSGAAAVIGAMRYLCQYDDVIGLVGLVENMPSGNAMKPGDIVQTPKGTVQILNTHAEGRLVLGDLVNYASELGCEYIIDIATLTGAANVVFGSVYTPICSNSDKLIKISQKVGKITGELTYPLPSGPEYNFLTKGTDADYQNIPNQSMAGVIAGAMFIKLFLSEKAQWLHLDIASTALTPNCFSESMFNGYGVRHLIEIVRHIILNI